MKPSKYRHTTNRYAWGNWTGIPHAFYRVLAQLKNEEGRPIFTGNDNIACSDLLAGMINMATRSKLLEDNEGWFKYPLKKARSHFHISRDVLDRMIALLKEADLIESAPRGMPATTWIRVNIERIDRLTEAAEFEMAEEMDDEEDGNAVCDTSHNQECGTRRTQECGSGRNQECGTRRNLSIYKKERKKESNGVLTNAEHQRELKVNGHAGVLFPHLDNRKASQEDIAFTQTLKDVVKNNTRMVARWRIKAQARHFAILRKDVGPDRLKEVFDWYCSHIKETKKLHLPDVSSPSQFRKRWEWIENRFDRWQEDHPPEVEVSNEAKAVVKRLRNVPWPKGADKDLPQLVQLGMDEYRAFKKKIVALKKELEKDIERQKKKKGTFNTSKLDMVSLFLGRMPAYTEFVEEWFSSVRDEINSYKDYRGSIKSRKIRSDSEGFEKYCLQWSERWPKIKEMLE